MGRSRTFQILLALAGFAFVACNDKFMAQSARSKTSALAAISTTVDEAGNISGTIDPSASATQLLKFSSGELAGSAIAIPPGALSIPVSVTVGAGESLSSSQFLQDVGITNNSISAAGPSVAFTPSQPVEATNPLTLSIPFSSGSSLSLTTSNDNIVVLYRWTKVVNGESSHSMGIIPAKDVVIAKDKVSFQTTKFGVFQLGKAETKIVERVNVQSVQPPAPKRDVSNPLVGSWGACKNSVNRDEFQEPVFLNPEWTNISVNQFGVRFGIRGKGQPMRITSSSKEDCSDDGLNHTPPISKGFLAKSRLSGSPVYHTLTDSAGNVSKSCQAVYPLKAFTVVSSFRRYSKYNDDTDALSHHLAVDWRGSGTRYQVDVFSNSNCSSPDHQSNRITSYSEFMSADIDLGLDISRVASFKITDQDNDSNSSSCIELPKVVSSSQGGLSGDDVSLSKIIKVWELAVSAVQFDLSWGRFPGLETNGFKLKFYTDYLCEATNSAQPEITTTESRASMSLHNATRSLQISDDSGATLLADPVCLQTASLPSVDLSYFTRYNAGDNWVHLEWTTAEAVDLLQHAGLDCSGAGTNVLIDKLGDGSQATWAAVNNLKPGTKYSFSLKTRTGGPVCQNVMMASADAPDWSSGNGMEWFESAGVAPEFDSQVTDGKDYKLRVSINGLVPVETYSQVIPRSGQSALVKIPAAEAQGQFITLWTPNGCSFISSDGDRSPALPLPRRPGENMPKVLCDGAMDGEHGRGDFFGANPRSPMMSKSTNLKITNGAFAMIEDLFESANCAADTRISSIVENGGMGLPAKDLLKDTHPTDMTIKSRVGVMFTDAGVTAANRISPEKYGCGLKGWVKGQRMDLKDSSCGDDMGQTKYDRIKIVGDRLYFCEIQGEKDSYGKTPEMRIPTCEINEQSFFLKRQ
jgi:hypothetical protein